MALDQLLEDTDCKGVYLLLQELYKAVREVNKKISSYRDLFKHKPYVREILVEPILRVLGWDPSNPDSVLPGAKAIIGNRELTIDFLLRNNNGFIGAVFVEEYGSPLVIDKYYPLIGSREFKNVKYIIVTDGARWEVYSYNKTHIISINLLLGLGTIDEVLEKLDGLLKLLNYRVISGEFLFIQRRTTMEKELEEAEEPRVKCISIRRYDREKHGFPIRIELPDGTIIRENTWRGYLYRFAKWLIENNYITTKDLPVMLPSADFRYIINDKPVHSNGDRFRAPKLLKKGFFIELHASSKFIMRVMKFLAINYGVRDVRVCISVK